MVASADPAPAPTRGPNRRRRGPSAAPSAQLLRQLRSAIAAVAGPVLEDAACAGEWSLFDPRREGEEWIDYSRRADVAKTICDECPALAKCAAWEATGAAPAGTLAGRTPEQRTRTPHRHAS